MTDDDAPAADLAIGSLVAGYLLEKLIGRGGMAAVFRAHDQRLDRRVALKILSPGQARDEAFRQRFIRESRTAAAVDHPNIIPIFEAGATEGGSLFIAMRYVQGGDIGSVLRRQGHLPASLTCSVITQVAAALDAAHVRGMVHRDVKPGNILVDAQAPARPASSLDPAPDHVYLSDFGISKHTVVASHLTSSGEFVGTLDYVAPEQIEGRPLDGRADQYSLACTAYELLSGAPPFRREHGVALIYAHLSGDPPPLTASRPDLPAAIDRVMARAMAKHPGARYPSCRDFAAELARALGQGQVTAAAERTARSGPGETAAATRLHPAGPPPPRAADQAAGYGQPYAGSRGPDVYDQPPVHGPGPAYDQQGRRGADAGQHGGHGDTADYLDPSWYRQPGRAAHPGRGHEAGRAQGPRGSQQQGRGRQPARGQPARHGPSRPAGTPALPAAPDRLPAPATGPHRRRRRSWLVAAAVVVLLAAGGATAAVLALHPGGRSGGAGGGGGDQPPPTAGALPCKASALRVSLGPMDPVQAVTNYPIDFLNTGTASCTLDGYPGVSLTGQGNSQVGAAALHSEGLPAPVTLPPGVTAHAELQVIQSAEFAACHPEQVSGLRVYPPGVGKPSDLALVSTGCLDRQAPVLNVSVVTDGAALTNPLS